MLNVTMMEIIAREQHQTHLQDAQRAWLVKQVQQQTQVRPHRVSNRHSNRFGWLSLNLRVKHNRA